MALDLNSYHNMLTNLISNTSTLKERLLVLPANELVAEIDYRITQTGIGTDGAKIADYSKKKSWATKSSFDNQENFKPKTTKSGRVRTSVTLEEGYYELRKIQSYRVDFMNLERTGAGIKNIKVGSETERKVSIGFTDLKQSIKFRGNEDRLNKQILNPTAGEIAIVAQVQVREYELFIKEIFAKK